MTGVKGPFIHYEQVPLETIAEIKIGGTLGRFAARQGLAIRPERRAGLPIMEQSPRCAVMLTANTDDATMEQAGNYGAAGYIPKPITSDNLLPAFKQALQMFYKCHP